MAPRGSSEDPKVTALRESRCLNPHPEQVTDLAFLAEEFFDARDAVQVKYEMVRRVTLDGAPVTATAAAFGYSRPSYYQAAAALAASGLDGLVPGKPGPRGGHKLTAPILAWAEQQLAADPQLKAGRPGRSHRRGIRGARAPPLRRAGAGPPPGAPQKPLTHPLASRRPEDGPSLSPRPPPGHAAAEPDRSLPGPDAGQVSVPGGVLDARYEQLRHAALHARASAFPLGLGVLTGKGVTAWRRLLACLTSSRYPRHRATGRHRSPGAATGHAPGSGDHRTRPCPGRRRRRAGRHLTQAIPPIPPRPPGPGRSTPCSPAPRRRR